MPYLLTIAHRSTKTVGLFQQIDTEIIGIAQLSLIIMLS